MIEVGLVIAVILAIVVSVVIIRRGPDRSGKPVENTALPDIQLGLKLQEDLRTMASQGHTEHAIKQLRKHAKVTPHEATLVVQALMVGKVFPDPATPTTPTMATETSPSAVVDHDLLNRLHALVAQDPHKRTAAVQLLRDHTGMSNRDARRFIDAL